MVLPVPRLRSAESSSLLEVPLDELEHVVLLPFLLWLQRSTHSVGILSCSMVDEIVRVVSLVHFMEWACLCHACGVPEVAVVISTIGSKLFGLCSQLLVECDIVVNVEI